MTRFASLIFLLLLGCKAKDESPAKESKPLQQTADSVSNTRIDGTETDTSPPTIVREELPARLDSI